MKYNYLKINLKIWLRCSLLKSHDLIRLKRSCSWLKSTNTFNVNTRYISDCFVYIDRVSSFANHLDGFLQYFAQTMKLQNLVVYKLGV